MTTHNMDLLKGIHVRNNISTADLLYITNISGFAGCTRATDEDGREMVPKREKN